jgi:putative transposase
MVRNCEAGRSTSGPMITACGCSSSSRASRFQNAHIESFNARLREECLNEHVFVSLDDARYKIEKWRLDYNRERPHSSLGNLTRRSSRQNIR